MVTGRRIWQIIRNVILVFVGIIVLFFVTVVPWFFTRYVTHDPFSYPDPNNGKTPVSYGIRDFDWVHFHSSDGVLLRGWYVPAADSHPKGTIVFVHGMNRSRVEMLPMEAFAHGLGYNGLLFDLRNSGVSGKSVGTLGYHERWDVEAAVREALDREHAQKPVILWGISMGAAASLEAAAETPDVAGVISDSTFLSFRNVIKHQASLIFHLPSFPIADEVIAWSAWRGGFNPSHFDLRTAVKRINPRPILFIAVAHDRVMPPSIARTLDALSTSPQSRLVIVPGFRHGEGFTSGHAQYTLAVKQFLAQIK